MECQIKISRQSKSEGYADFTISSRLMVYRERELCTKSSTLAP